MDENKLLSIRGGFAPKAFFSLPDDSILGLLEGNGLPGFVGYNEVAVENWFAIFQKVNSDIINSLPGKQDMKNLAYTDMEKEARKVALATGNTIIFMYLNLSKKDWPRCITEYMVYVGHSTGSIAGSVIYWLALQCFLEEGGVRSQKGKYLLRFIVKRHDFIAAHKYYDEIETFAKTFPFKPLQLKSHNLMDVVSLLELYPNGILNRFMAKHFPQTPKTLSREDITKILQRHVKLALNGFDAEKLWKEGDTNAIRDFLMESAIHKNRIANHELFQSTKSDYIGTIKKWLHSQTSLFKELITLEQLNIARHQAQNHEAGPKIPAKYYALYHRVLIDMKREKDFNRLDDDRYSRKEIEQFAKRSYPQINPQSFYRGFIELEGLSNKTAIARSYKGFKQKIAVISKNNPDILHYLKQFPG